ncbi:hypothetical protein BO99DRAFT_115563 [Aspergillus violaceofuscus CBS 115571]|uniref:Uncharacterized protein n=1 Tax=Aspergillus violaceofuscus (strain CBS 115571) TaxID=1450538 RepID=A0A2V5IK76_ASPV1|nr:hypothetical protein BO99DRAFT_115563 [Aspergillus violaceofuscus CBS 115571]
MRCLTRCSQSLSGTFLKSLIRPTRPRSILESKLPLAFVALIRALYAESGIMHIIPCNEDRGTPAATFHRQHHHQPNISNSIMPNTLIFARASRESLYVFTCLCCGLIAAPFSPLLAVSPFPSHVHSSTPISSYPQDALDTSQPKYFPGLHLSLLFCLQSILVAIFVLSLPECVLQWLVPLVVG